MLLKELESITFEDLQELLDNSVNESKTLEYKKVLNLNSENEKKEFLNDVSSFANSSGGDIIYGIGEKSGNPNSLEGFQIENLDLLIQQIENILRDGIEPRIAGIIIRPIENPAKNYILIIRIPKSWISPHRTNYKNSRRFFARNSNGKYELDIQELRRSFALSDSISSRLKSFREDRISRIISNDTPAELKGERKVALHIVPLVALTQSQSYDIRILKTKSEYSIPFCAGPGHTSYNFDGILSINGYRGSDLTSYTQFYKNGIIEGVTTKLEDRFDSNTISIPNTIFETCLFSALRAYFPFYQSINVDFPLYLFVTLINFKGAKLAISYNLMQRYDAYFIDRDILPIPEVYIEDSKINLHSILRPIFDTLWNTCGYERCLHYDNQGNYKQL